MNYLVAITAALLLSTSVNAQVAADKDTPAQTASGIKYTHPEGFLLERSSNALLLASPERDLKMALVEVGSVATATEAASNAWQAHQRAFARTIRLETPEAPKDGWDERVSFRYETSPNEKRYVAADALRQGSAWTVLLVDSSQGAIEKRSVAPRLFRGSIRPANYQAESFAGKPPHKLDPARVESMTRNRHQADPAEVRSSSHFANPMVQDERARTPADLRIVVADDEACVDGPQPGVSSATCHSCRGGPLAPRLESARLSGRPR